LLLPSSKLNDGDADLVETVVRTGALWREFVLTRFWHDYIRRDG
jgi:hypothetical protein